MKILLCLFIMMTSFIIGYGLKMKRKIQVDFFSYLQSFSNFFQNNVSLFKDNLVGIIDKYILIDENKNAKFNEIFKKNGMVYEFDEKKIKKFIAKEEDQEIVMRFFKSLGGNEYEFEKTRLVEFLDYLDKRLLAERELLKTKGDLWLKLLLSVGGIICILIW